MSLTPKQRRFAEEYAKEPVGLSAALNAGYSENYARTHIKVLLGNPDIVSEIKRIRRRLNERAERSATDVVNQLGKIAFADHVSFLKEDPLRPGSFIYKSPSELTEEQRDVVDKVVIHDNVRLVIITDGVKEEIFRQEYDYVFTDKANALQLMGRHFGIFDDKLKLTMAQQNPFKNATPEQLEKLRRSFVGIMNTGDVVDAEFEEATPMLSHDKRRGGARRKRRSA